VIDPDDCSSDAFFNKARGGIRFYCDRFKCFLEAGGACELRWYVNFLLESLISVTDPNLFKAFPEANAAERQFIARLFQDDQTRIELVDAGKDISISYLNREGNAPDYRLSPYFKDVLVPKTVWKDAAIEALDEYFSVAEERLESNHQSKLHDLVARWKRNRPALVGVGSKSNSASPS
jgi:hypothetical protein